MTAEEKRLRALLVATLDDLRKIHDEKYDARLSYRIDRIETALERSEASKRGKSNRSRGHESERMVARYLREEHNFPDAATTRELLGSDGTRQPGDVSFAPGVVLSVKHVKTPAWPAWIRQVKEEAQQAGPAIPATFSPRIPAVVHRLAGERDVGKWPTAVPESHWDGLVQDRYETRIGNLGQLLYMFPSVPVIANGGVVVMRFGTFVEAVRLDK